MLEIRDLEHAFGPVRALDGVGFCLTRGEVVALLGPNGAGKTTTIRSITGYLQPDRGAITLAGHDLRKDPIAARSRLGYLPESAPLYPEMTPTSYLEFRARLHGIARRDRSGAVAKSLDRCGVRDVARRRIGTLSKGYKQRVGLAAALVHEPAVLVLDEPSNGLDPTQIREMRALVRSLAEERTMLVSSHILPEVERLADRMVVIAGGRVLATGSADELAAAHAEGPRTVLDVRLAPGGAPPHPNGLQLIETTTLDDGWTRATYIGPNAGESLGAVCQASALPIRSLQTERASLESVFLRLVQRSEGSS